MTLYKRGSIWWAYVWMDGVRHAKTTGTANRRHAQTIGQAFEEELNLKRHQLPRLRPDMTVDELAALFIAEGLAKTYALERLDHVLPFFGSMRLAEIDKAAVRRFRKERHEASTIKVATANRDLSVLRRLLYFGVEEGYIAANPLARIHMERERRTKRPVLSVREERLLLAAASDHLAKIVVCALDTGMRRGRNPRPTLGGRRLRSPAPLCIALENPRGRNEGDSAHKAALRSACCHEAGERLCLHLQGRSSEGNQAGMGRGASAFAAPPYPLP